MPNEMVTLLTIFLKIPEINNNLYVLKPFDIDY